MDELEILKKDWQKNQKFPKLSKKEIYRLLHKKSSSIVKWIFILSIIEFCFWTLISLLMKDSEAQQRFDSYDIDYIIMPLMISGYIILAYFFVAFYKNYKKILNIERNAGEERLDEALNDFKNACVIKYGDNCVIISYANEEETIKNKLNFFHELNKIPNILFHGQSGSGKRTIVNDFIHKIYDNNKEIINPPVINIPAKMRIVGLSL